MKKHEREALKTKSIEEFWDSDEYDKICGKIVRSYHIPESGLDAEDVLSLVTELFDELQAAEDAYVKQVLDEAEEDERGEE